MVCKMFIACIVLANILNLILIFFISRNFKVHNTTYLFDYVIFFFYIIKQDIHIYVAYSQTAGAIGLIFCGHSWVAGAGGQIFFPRAMPGPSVRY